MKSDFQQLLRKWVRVVELMSLTPATKAMAYLYNRGDFIGVMECGDF